MKTAYITDSMTTLDESYLQQHDIHVVPLEMILDGVSYAENVDLSPQYFYDNIANYKDLKTSQPTIGKITEKFKQLKAEGYEKVVVMTLSSKGSGSYATYNMAKDMFDLEIEVIDSYGASYTSDRLLKAVVEQGETVEQLQARIAKSKFIVIPQDLKQLHRSGRVSGLSFLLGSLLKIQPILEMKDGKVLLQEKVRNRKQVEQYVLTQLGQAPVEHNFVHIQHTCDEAFGEAWRQLLLRHYPHLTITLGIVPSSVGVHNGAGTVIFSWFYE